MAEATAAAVRYSESVRVGPVDSCWSAATASR